MVRTNKSNNGELRKKQPPSLLYIFNPVIVFGIYSDLNKILCLGKFVVQKYYRLDVRSCEQ